MCIYYIWYLSFFVFITFGIFVILAMYVLHLMKPALQRLFFSSVVVVFYSKMCTVIMAFLVWISVM